MSEETTTPAEQAEETQQTFTQDDVNRIVAQRLARAKTEPPADYAELKEKAAKYDEAQEAAKSELQKATERAERAERELADYRSAAERAAKVAEVARDTGVDADILGAMTGDIEENARLLASKRPTVYATDSGEQTIGGATNDPAKEFARWLKQKG